MNYRYFGYPGNNWMGYGVSWVFQVAFWLIIIWVIYALVKRSRHSDESDSGSGRSSALDILKQRYAKGEITKKEFEEIKKDIA